MILEKKYLNGTDDPAETKHLKQYFEKDFQ